MFRIGRKYDWMSRKNGMKQLPHRSHCWCRTWLIRIKFVPLNNCWVCLFTLFVLSEEVNFWSKKKNLGRKIFINNIKYKIYYGRLLMKTEEPLVPLMYLDVYKIKCQNLINKTNTGLRVKMRGWTDTFHKQSKSRYMSLFPCLILLNCVCVIITISIFHISHMKTK